MNINQIRIERYKKQYKVDLREVTHQAPTHRGCVAVMDAMQARIERLRADLIEATAPANWKEQK